MAQPTEAPAAACNFCGTPDASSTSPAGLARNLVKAKACSKTVGDVLARLDRKVFTSSTAASSADPYADAALPDGYGAQLSAPHVHAMTLELLKPGLLGDAKSPARRFLDIGCGSGLMTAAMALLGGSRSHVVGVEHIHELATAARANMRLVLGSRGSTRVQIITGDGTDLGLLPNATRLFDAIHCGASAEKVPLELVKLLKPGGRLVCPIGPPFDAQQLTLCLRNKNEATDGESDVGALLAGPPQEVMRVQYVPLRDSDGQRASVGHISELDQRAATNAKTCILWLRWGLCVSLLVVYLIASGKGGPLLTQFVEEAEKMMPSYYGRRRA